MIQSYWLIASHSAANLVPLRYKILSRSRDMIFLNIKNNHTFKKKISCGLRENTVLTLIRMKPRCKKPCGPRFMWEGKREHHVFSDIYSYIRRSHGLTIVGLMNMAHRVACWQTKRVHDTVQSFNNACCMERNPLKKNGYHFYYFSNYPS